MTKIRFISVLLLISLFAVLTGCGGGGGGSSTPVEKDVTGITSTLNGYLASLRASDPAAAAKFFASTAPTSPGSVHTILIKDFGITLGDETESSISYNFLVYPEDIVQPSNEIAFVKATYTLHSGARIIIRFSLVKESGVWLIDNMEVETTTDSESHANPGAFVTKNFYPLQENITRLFALTDGSDAALTDRIYESFSSSYTDSGTGIVFYELSETETVPGNADYEGAPAPSSSMRNSGRSLRANTAPFFYDASSIYFGYDSAGALWMKTPESNYGVPFKLLESSHAYGSSREIGIFWYDDDEIMQTGTVTVNIGYPTNFPTPLQSYTVVPLTFLTTWSNGANQHKWVLHLASGIGTVGADHFTAPSSIIPAAKERIMQRFSSDLSLNQRNDPAISTAVNLGSYYDGQTIASVQLTSTGGTAPYTYSLDSSSFVGTGITMTSSGSIAGSIAGTPPLGDHTTVIKVVDKFGRHSTRTFSMTVVSAPVVYTVSFSKSANSSALINTSHEDLITSSTGDHTCTLLSSSPSVDSAYADVFDYRTNPSYNAWLFSFYPQTAGTYSFVIRVTFPDGSYQDFTRVVVVMPDIALASPLNSPVSINTLQERNIYLRGSLVNYYTYSWEIIPIQPDSSDFFAPLVSAYVDYDMVSSNAMLKVTGNSGAEGQTIKFQIRATLSVSPFTVYDSDVFEVVFN